MSLDVNRTIFNIWEKYSHNETHKKIFEELINKNGNKRLRGKDPLNDLCPITYKKSEYSKPEGFDYRFLFSGFNPSFNEKHYIEKCLKNRSIKDPYKFFKYDENSVYNDNIVNVDYSLRNKDSGLEESYYKTYFDRLQKFIDEDIFQNNYYHKFHHVHIDPFFIRGTNQSQAKTILGIENDNKRMSDFADEQLKLFELIIENYDPTHIIILNATASHILSNRWRSKNRNKKNIDTSFEFRGRIIFCGGMLFGAGGMDSFSKERFAKEIRDHLKED